MEIFENEILQKKFKVILATDEVGRGPLAGPVVACSVMLDDQNFLEDVDQFLKNLGVTDSKKLTDKKRKSILENLNLNWQDLRDGDEHEIIDHLSCAVSEVDHATIDKINILNSSLRAMSNSASVLAKEQLAAILVDGNRVPKELPSNIVPFTVVKGDVKSSLIGLASVIAKVYRDNLMAEFDAIYPGYGFSKHAGYPTKAHYEALLQLGPCPIHRLSFKGVKN